jgi:hypothetical protein
LRTLLGGDHGIPLHFRTESCKLPEPEPDEERGREDGESAEDDATA